MQLMPGGCDEAREGSGPPRIVSIIMLIFAASSRQHRTCASTVEAHVRLCSAQHVHCATQQGCDTTRPFMFHFLHLCCVCRWAFSGKAFTFPRDAWLRRIAGQR